MFDAFIEGLILVLQWKAFSLMLVGMALGFCVGLLPGIGGAATLALMIPFIFKMSPAEAFAFLLGMHSVAATTGDITPAKRSRRPQWSMATQWRRKAKPAARSVPR